MLSSRNHAESKLKGTFEGFLSHNVLSGHFFLFLFKIYLFINYLFIIIFIIIFIFNPIVKYFNIYYGFQVCLFMGFQSMLMSGSLISSVFFFCLFSLIVCFVLFSFICFSFIFIYFIIPDAYWFS